MCGLKLGLGEWSLDQVLCSCIPRGPDGPANQPKTGNGGKDDVALTRATIGLTVLL